MAMASPREELAMGMASHLVCLPWQGLAMAMASPTRGLAMAMAIPTGDCHGHANSPP